MRASEENPWTHHVDNIPVGDKALYLEHPFVLLHKSWPTEQEIERKRQFYKRVRGHEMPHPKETFGDLHPLPKYARMFE